jgi:hypothetical protein
VPETVLRPTVTEAGNVPVMLLNEKRSEKLMTVPPVAAEMNFRKYALVTSAPRPGVRAMVMEFPVVKDPVVTSVDMGIWPSC